MLSPGNEAVIAATKAPKTNGILLLVAAAFVMVLWFAFRSTYRHLPKGDSHLDGARRMRARIVHYLYPVFALAFAVTGIVVLITGR